jgi:Kef-type K+ transport system membrane component KefB
MSYLPAWPLEITSLIGFGMMLLIGAVGGYVAHRVSWLPSITGFMIVGLLCGPSGLDLLNDQVMAQSRMLIDIALGLILYRLGLSLDIKHLLHTPRLLLVSLVESLLTFVAVFALMKLLDVSTAIAALVSAIAISSSPAVLLHVAHEVGAEGEVTDSTQTLVTLNNLFSFLAFSAVLPMLHYSVGADWSTVLLHPLYQLIGSLLLGTLTAYGLHQIASATHSATQYKLALVIGTIMLTLGLAHELKLSMFFAPLVVGVVVKTLERGALVSDIDFGPSFELFFIVLFVFAGAGLHLSDFISYAPAVLLLVVVRSLAKISGVFGATAALRQPLRGGVASGLLMVPMAGLAVGLVQASSDLFPELGPSVAAIVLGSVAVFETIGPPLAAFAFRLAREDYEYRSQGENGIDFSAPLDEAGKA